MVGIIWDTSIPSFFLKCGSTNDHAPIFCASSWAQMNSKQNKLDHMNYYINGDTFSSIVFSKLLMKISRREWANTLEEMTGL